MLKSIAQQFEDGTFPRDQWNHAAHLTVAGWYLAHYPVMEAMQRIRRGIQAYNAAHNSQGYHETLTIFWMRIAAAYLIANDHCDNLETLTDGLIAACGNRNLALEYYSRDLLYSDEARHGWVEPDLQPFIGI